MVTIKEYVDRMFRNIPASDRSEEIKQEIIQNLQEKVNDLIDEGKTEEDAINKAIVEFGDFDEVIRELEPETPGEKPLKRIETNEQRYRKTTNAFLFSLCGSTIIIALAVFINLYYTPKSIWFVYPLFAVIWWPIAMFFSWLNRRSRR